MLRPASIINSMISRHAVLVFLAVILLTGCGQSTGARKNPEEQLILIQPGPALAGGVNFGNQPIPLTITVEDAEAIARDCPAVATAAPVVRARQALTHERKEWVPLYIYGTTPQYLDVRQWPLEHGRIWTDPETKRSAEVCVLGQTVARELFGEAPPLGKVVRVNDCSLKVIGILSAKGANLMGLDQDDVVLAPWTTVRNKIAVKVEPARPVNVDSIWARVDNAATSSAAVRQVADLLRRRHRIPADQPDDFNIRDNSEMIRALKSISTEHSNTLVSLWVLVAIGAVVLLITVTAAVLVFCGRTRKK